MIVCLQAYTTLQKDLTEKYSVLQEEEKIVNLQLDEISIKLGVVYKGGKVIGLAEDKAKHKTSSVQTFMISSLFSLNKDVVVMHPVKNLNAEQLLNFRGNRPFRVWWRSSKSRDRKGRAYDVIQL